MEDVLEVYTRAPDPKRPLVCLDEFCKQLLADVRHPLPPKPAVPARYDSEYSRRGTASGFMLSTPHLGRREVFVGSDARRTAKDYAECLEHVAEHMFPHAEKIILVMDNLNTHQSSSLYSTFKPEKAFALAQRFEIHYTPKHGSWLNIAEIEISALARSCLDRRVSSKEAFRSEVGAYLAARNHDAAPVKWLFSVQRARSRLTSLYPKL